MRISFVVLAVVSSACTKDGNPTDPGDDDDDDTASEASFEASVVLSDVINTVAFVSWSPPAGGESWVEYGLAPEELTFSTPRTTAAPDPHEQIVLGMKAGRTYHWRAVTEVDGVRMASEVGEVTTGPAPDSVTTLDVVVSDATRFDPAPWLLTVALGDPATAVIYDREGDPVWYAASPSNVRKMHTARPGWDGKTIVYGYYDQDQDAVLGGIYRVGMDGRSTVFSPTLEADHDFVERKDGTFAYLHLETRENVDVEGDIVPVAATALYETGEGDDPTVNPPTEIFNQFDDSGQTPYWTCSHMIDEEVFAFHQWTHANSLIPDPHDPDNFYWIMYRFQDSLVKIDRTNGRIDWQIGGRNDDTDLVEEDGFDHGHLSHFWPGGFLMFDNNTHSGGTSRVREYAYDQATKHVALVRQWPGASKTPAMADARRTSVNTVIINWVGDDMIQERTDADEVVWQANLTGATTGRITLLDDLYDLDDPYDY